jgi:hypothetical protein
MRVMDAKGRAHMARWHPMGSPDPLRLVLDLEPADDPVRGWLQGPDGVRKPFVGLLGLLAVLDEARARGRPRLAGSDPEPPPAAA